MGVQKWIIFCVTFLGVQTLAFGQEVKIEKIHIEGNHRVERAAILNQITTRSGTLYSSKQVRKSIENIYKLGFFDAIEVDYAEKDGLVTLTYILKEKPSIRKIEYRGNKKIETSDLKEAAQIKEYAILDLNKIRTAREKLIKLYEQKGFFLAQVAYSITEDKKTNEVDLFFDIEELDKVKIRKINFIGNKAFKEDQLKSVMATKEGGLFSWLTKTDNYQEEVLKGDVEGLMYYYHTKGYVQVKIEQPLITISPDKKWIYVVIPIDEGDLYTIGKIDYDGDLLFSKDDLKKGRLIQNDVLFNRDFLRQEVLRLGDKYKDQGYAYANVNVRSNVREKDKKVDLIFDFEKGQKVYFGNVYITGNTSTRDHVIRRELKINEGDLYNETNLRKSIDRVRALGYFSEVTYTKPQGSSDDLLNINIEVKERSTGALTVGAGWSSVDQFIANAQISHNNLFGRGHEVAFNAQLSTGKSGSNRFSTSFTEPYTFGSLWSSGFDAYNVETRAQSFTEQKVGGDIRMGHPIGEDINTYLTYKIEEISLKDVLDTTLIKGDGVVSSVLGTFLWDGRNNRFEPTKGYYDLFSLEYAGLGGDNYFVKPIAKSRFYYPSYFSGVFRVNLELGGLFRTTDRLVPTSERFILGGINSLRGFAPFSIGPKEVGVDGKSVLVGGDRQIFSNIEYEIPLIPQMGVKGVLFLDVGTAFDGNVIDVGSIRSDAGFGFRWFSPFGPLRVEVGFPFDPRGDEKTYVPQFAITPPF